MRLIAVDPGVNIGFALADAGLLVACGTVQHFQDLPRAPLAVIEMPRVYPSVARWKGDPQDIVKLAYLAGQIAQNYPAHVRVEPMKTPKRIRKKRAMAMLLPNERHLVKRLSNHAWDAIAILFDVFNRRLH